MTPPVRIRSTGDALRVRVLTHTAVLPFFALWLRVTEMIHTIETRGMEFCCWYPIAVFGCSFTFSKGLFVLLPSVYTQVDRLAAQPVWGISALAIAVIYASAVVRRYWPLPAWAPIPRIDVRMVAPGLGAYWYGCFGGSFLVQNYGMPGGWLWSGAALGCTFFVWRRIIDAE